jgi:hypothetical protein
MKRIVVGIDATPAMAPVVNWVERFAADVGVHVDVVHVVPRSVLMAISSMQANSDAYLKNMRAQLACDGVAVVTGLTLSYACMATCLRRRRIRWRSRSDAPPQTPWSIWLFSA